MPDELCRACGGELIRHKLCSECRKPTQKKCMACENVTHTQNHDFCMKKLLPQEKQVIQVIQKNNFLKARKNSIPFSLLAIGIIGFLAVGFITSLSLNVTQNMPDEAQATNANNIGVKNVASIAVGNEGNIQTIFGKSFDNCLAYGSGESLTITCPTNYGYVYKGILNMPEDLSKDFSNSVFSIRGMSLIENFDNSVTLLYLHKQYTTTFFGN